MYWDAFWFLHARRTYHASGPNPITVEAISIYADTLEEFRRVPFFKDRMLHYVAAMDDLFLKIHYQKQQAVSDRSE